MLTTVDQVIEKLGGTARTAEIAGVLPQAVSNWRARQAIPSDKYLQISEALAAVKEKAAPGIFSFRAGAAA